MRVSNVTMCVMEDAIACVCTCVLSKRLLALLMVHRWVFTIGKGELERKWWTPCVAHENVPEGNMDTALFTGMCVVVLEIQRGSWDCIHMFAPLLPSCPSDCAYTLDWLSPARSVCVNYFWLFDCVRVRVSLVVCWVSVAREESVLPGSRRAASPSQLSLHSSGKLLLGSLVWFPTSKNAFAFINGL